MKSLIALALLTCFSACAHAAEPHIRGSISCAQWTEERGRDTDTYERGWLLGYLSAMAVKTGEDFWGPSKGPDTLTENEMVYRWMDAYCRSNPLQDVDDGAQLLFVERTRSD